MKPLPASSGDLIADRRADYAEMVFANGDHAAAVEFMLRRARTRAAVGNGMVQTG